jgi:hypothetical protein
MNVHDTARNDVVPNILLPCRLRGCGGRKPLPSLPVLGLGDIFLLRDAQQIARRDALIKKLIVLCVKIQILQYHMKFERFAMVRGSI